MVAGMSLVVSMTLAPMREDMRLMREDIRLLRGEVSSLRQDMADIRGRLTRVETLLEQNTGRPQAPESP